MWNICCGTFGSARGDPVIQDQHKKRLRAVIKMFFVMGLIRIVEIIRFIFDIMYGNTNLTIRRLSLFFDIMIALQVCIFQNLVTQFFFFEFPADMFSVSHFFQKSSVARGPRTGLFARKNESIVFSEFKFEI